MDTTVIMSALLKDSTTRKLILGKKFSLLSIWFSQTEIKKYESYILKKAGLAQKDYETVFEKIFGNITLFDETEISNDFFEKAFQIMKNIDEKDTPFLALSMQENCSIWSEDTHFKKQKTVKAFSTKDLVKKTGMSESFPEKNEKIIQFGGKLEGEWKNIDSQKFVSSLRDSDKKNETRFKELEKHWK
ncbi:MAG: PIN domain-containing protein [archaeon]|nr:PIN domain-containing protein [archaeon]